LGTSVKAGPVGIKTGVSLKNCSKIADLRLQYRAYGIQAQERI
jgi:hypothetical protein